MKLIFNKIDAFWNKPLELQLHAALSILFVLYLADGETENAIFKLPFVALGVVFLLLSTERRFRKFFWLTNIVIFLIDVWVDYTLLANHYFLFGFLSMVMFLSYTIDEKEQDKFLKNQTLIAFAIVMFFSGLQKLLSPQFMRGDVLGFFFVTDSFASFLLDYFPVLHEHASSNLDKLTRFSNTDPEQVEQLVLHPVMAGFSSVSKYFSWFVVALEVLIGALAFLASRSKIYHWLVISLVFGIFLIRQECGFLALAVVILMPSLTKKHSGFYRLYFITVVLFITFILADLAYG